MSRVILFLIYWNVFVMEVQLVLTHISLSFAPTVILGTCLVNKHGTPLLIQLLTEWWLQKQIYRKQNEFIISVLNRKSEVMSCYILSYIPGYLTVDLRFLTRKACLSYVFHCSIYLSYLMVSHMSMLEVEKEVLWERLGGNRNLVLITSPSTFSFLIYLLFIYF